MRGKTHEHEHAAHMKKAHRKTGGRVKVDEEEAVDGGGNPDVEKEAEEKKHGGRAKRKAGGHVEGKKAHHRADRPKRKHGGKAEHEHEGNKHMRPGRKTGGRVGSDKSPLSSANRIESGPGPGPRTEEGGMSR